MVRIQHGTKRDPKFPRIGEVGRFGLTLRKYRDNCLGRLVRKDDASLELADHPREFRRDSGPDVIPTVTIAKRCWLEPTFADPAREAQLGSAARCPLVCQGWILSPAGR